MNALRLHAAVGGITAAIVLLVLSTSVALGQEPASTIARDPGVDAVERSPLKASSRKAGILVTTQLTGPLVAGEPTVLRTRVKNTGGTPVWWYPGAAGPQLRVTMVEAIRRLGQPLSHIAPGRLDLKSGLFGFGIRNRVVNLPFERHRANGQPWSRTSADVATGPVRIDAGEELVFTHRWDGRLHLDDLPGDIGLPPDGPVRIDVTGYFVMSPAARAGDRRTIRTWLTTEVVGGWSDDRLHPMEVVDAALADPDFFPVMATRDFGRYALGMLWWDDEQQHWLTGTCTYGDDRPSTWHLVAVDPYTGEAGDLIEGLQTKHCGRLPAR